MKQDLEKHNSKYIRKNIIVEWLPGYIDYPSIKPILVAFKVLTIVYKKFLHRENHIHPEIEPIPPYQSDLILELGGLLEKLIRLEIRKCDAFAQYKMFELHASWRYIEECWAIFKKVEVRSHGYSMKRKCLKQAMQISYKNIAFANSFILLNQQILKAIFGKIDTYVLDFYKYRHQHLDTFRSRNTLTNLQTLNTESYLNFYTSAQSKQKLEELIVNRNKLTKGKTYFLLGLFLGFVVFQIFILIATLSLDVINIDLDDTDPLSLYYVFPMFRGVGLFILYLWGLGWNVYGFNKFNINYRLILKFDNHYSTYGQIMKRAGFFTVLLLLMYMLFIVGKQYSLNTGHYLPIQYTPFIVYMVFFAYIFFPSQYVFNPRGRKYFYRILLNILYSPFIPMTFIIAWSTDQMVSFVGPLKDLSYAICYYTSDFSLSEVKECQAYNTIQGVTTGYVVALIPLLYRMIQCVKQALESSEHRFWGHIQMWNFFKYATSVMTATLSFVYRFNKAIFAFFVASSVISTCYAYYWDLKYDWGFLQGGSRNRLLRDALSYKSSLIYYLAIISNFVLRCSWTLSISSFVTAQIDPLVLGFLTSFLEMFRRCMWNFFRIEKEHLANCAAFRTTQDGKEVLKPINVTQVPKRKMSNQSDIYQRFDNNFQIKEHLSLKDDVKNKYETAYFMIFQTSDDMVRRAKLNFEKNRKESEELINSNQITDCVKKLYKAIGQQRLTLVNIQSKLKID